jgi:hypothetical protein
VVFLSVGREIGLGREPGAGCFMGTTSPTVMLGTALTWRAPDSLISDNTASSAKGSSVMAINSHSEGKSRIGSVQSVYGFVPFVHDTLTIGPFQSFQSDFVHNEVNNLLILKG